MYASFRGIKFHVFNAKDTFEWRHVIGEYLTERQPDVKRLSKAPRQFKVMGYLIGNDALLTKDMLVSACDKKHAGRLIHPLYGIKHVICVSMEIETLEATTSYRFSAEFIESKGISDNTEASKLYSVAKKVDNWATDTASKFCAFLEPIRVTEHTIDTLSNTILKVSQFTGSPNGLGVLNDTGNSIQTKGIATREKIKKSVHNTKNLINTLMLNAYSTDNTKTREYIESNQYVRQMENTRDDYSRAILSLIVLCWILNPAHNLRQSSSPTIKKIIGHLDKHYLLSASVFTALWEIEIKLIPNEKRKYGYKEYFNL